jgi:hypothetical protein
MYKMLPPKKEHGIVTAVSLDTHTSSSSNNNPLIVCISGICSCSYSNGLNEITKKELMMMMMR